MFKLFLLIFLTFPSVSGALTCLKDYAGTASCLENENTAGDCITLGYSTDNVEGCSNYLYCPFNTAYKKCVAGCELDCAEIGFTTSDKSSWCSDIITCPNDNTLTACVGKCVYADECVDKSTTLSASMPTNAQLTYTNCTACGETRKIATAWECKSGYGRAEINSNNILCYTCGNEYLKDENRDAYFACTDECYWHDYECGWSGSSRACEEADRCYMNCQNLYYTTVQC